MIVHTVGITETAEMTAHRVGLWFV